MKSHTRKYAAGKFRLAIPLLLLSLTINPIPAEAGVIDTVNNKVTNILNRVKTIGSNTSGLKEFIATLQDMRDSLGGGAISDMRDSIGETQGLIQFIKERRESAGQTSQYPSLPNLVRSLEGVIDVLTHRDGQGGALEALSAVLDVLPDKMLAPVARSFSRLGVDENFVYKIDQMTTDLVEVRDILEQTSARRDAASQVASIDWSIGVDTLYVAEFGCHLKDKMEMIKVSRGARVVKTYGNTFKFIGGSIETGRVLKSNKGIGVWGFVSLKIDVKLYENIGKRLSIIGDTMLNLVDRAEDEVGRCLDSGEFQEINKYINNLSVNS